MDIDVDELTQVVTNACTLALKRAFRRGDFGSNRGGSKRRDVAAAAKRKAKKPEDDNGHAVVPKLPKGRKVPSFEWVVPEDNRPRLAPHLADPAFRENFRMSRSTVECLLTLLGPSADENPGERFLIPTQVGTLMSLWMLGNQEPFREVAHRFGLGFIAAYHELSRFCISLSAKKEEFIAWPRGDSAVRSIEEFSEMCGASFPQIVGCAGVTNIKITSHKQSKIVTYLQLQAICDSSMSFFDVLIAELPSDDGLVWTISPASQVIRNWEENMLPPDAHLLASLAYPLHEHVMVPYKDTGRLTEREILFNSTLGSVRAVIKQAFGHLFARFRRLSWLCMLRKQHAPRMIVAACILHNLCIIEGDSIPDGVDVNSAVEVELAQGTEIILATPDADPAARKRNCIADLIWKAHTFEDITHGISLL